MQVGAAATGSHGSGVRHKGFQGYTAALDFVLPNGDIKSYDRETCGEEEMASVAVSYKHTILQPRDDIDRAQLVSPPSKGARWTHGHCICSCGHACVFGGRDLMLRWIAQQVGLGCLGPVSSVSVDICPSYDITQQCYRMPIAEYLPIPANTCSFSMQLFGLQLLLLINRRICRSRYLENFYAMVDAHDSVSTFANFGDGVVEWTFQRDKIESGSMTHAPGSFDPPSLIHDGAGSLITTPCKIYESDVEHPGTGVFNWHDGLHFFMHGAETSFCGAILKL